MIKYIKKYRFLVFIFFAFQTQSAAAGIYINVMPNIKKRVHSIGISSNLGDVAEITHIGATAFGNKWSQLSISDWQLNALVVEQATQALEKEFTVRATPLDSNLIAQAKKGLFKSDEGALSDVVRDLPPSDLDAYLIFLPTDEKFAYSSNSFLSGLGVFWRWPGFAGADPASHRGEAIIYIGYSIYLVDAKTHRVLDVILGRSLDEEKLSLADRLLTNAHPIYSPHLHTGLTDWPTTADALTDDQKAELKADLILLIKQSVAHTLAAEGLIVDTPKVAPLVQSAP